MDAIEVFFTAYGALLALAFAKGLAGAARLIRHRQTIRIGWATPLVILLLLFDIASCLTGAWRELGAANSELPLVMTCLMTGAAYYLAATLVTPETLVEGEDLDAHFARHKLFIVGGLLVANLLGSQLLQIQLKGFAEFMVIRWSGFAAVMNLTFYGLVTALLLIRNRATNIVMLATLNAIFVLVLLIF